MLDADSRTAIGKDFDALKEQINTIIDSSEFNGTNLLKASGGDVAALQSTDTRFDVIMTNVDLTAKSPPGCDLHRRRYGEDDGRQPGDDAEEPEHRPQHAGFASRKIEGR